MSKTLNARAVAWVVGGDCGISSRAIWAHMMGVTLRPDPFGGYPHDPDDFGRCARLLVAVPEWRPRITEMAQHGAVWAGLAAAWDELEALFVEEVGSLFARHGSAPRLYDRMKAIERAALLPAEERQP